MDVTPNYAFPYPECDPPLVQDSAQASQIKALAEAVDVEMTRIDNAGDRVLNHPARARITQAALSTATTLTLVDVPFDQVTFNSPGMSLSGGGVAVPDGGWYLVGGYASADSATTISTAIRFTLGGSPVTSWSTPGGIYSSTFQLPSMSLPLNIPSGSVLGMQIRHNTAGSPTWNYRAHLWAVRLITA